MDATWSFRAMILGTVLASSALGTESVTAQSCCSDFSSRPICVRPARGGLLARWRNLRRARTRRLGRSVGKVVCNTVHPGEMEFVNKDGQRFQVIRSSCGCAIHIPLPPGHPGIQYDRLSDGRIVPRSPFSLAGSSGTGGADASLGRYPCAMQFLSCCQVLSNDECMEQYLICIQSLQEEQLHTKCPDSVIDDSEDSAPQPDPDETALDAEPSPSDAAVNDQIP